MFISRVSIRNFRSFGEEQVFKPHEALSVLVGPNEAGKTSLLEAIAVLRNGIRQDQVRSGEDQSEVIIRLVPESEDIELFEATGVECAFVDLTYSSEKKTTMWGISPAPAKREFSEIEHLFDAAVESLGGRGAVFGNHRVSFAQLYEDKSPEKSDRDTVERTLSTFDTQQSLTDEVWKFRDALMAETGFELALSVIDPRIPRVLVFDEDQRELKSSYPLNRSTGNNNQKQPNWVPLDNILRLADFDPNALPPEQGKLRIIENDANERLRVRFAELWGARKPYPQIGVNNNRIHISVRDPENPDQDGLDAEQRSSGVIRMFEIIAFAGRAESQGKRVVVLADEIEQHLHYDAQVELLEWLERGALKAQIVTSTHSIGCWPSDIGTQMNSLERRNGNTIIHNGPYSRLEAGSGGLMASIGAARAAIGIRRPIIFSEGKTDEMLLPALFRDAGCDPSGVWFVGSISSSQQSAPPRYPSLETERFIVDGDEAGIAMLRKLIDSDPERSGKCFVLNHEGAETLQTVEDLIETALVSDSLLEWWDKKFSSDSPVLDFSQPVIAQVKAAVDLEHPSGKDERRKAMASFKSWLRERVLDRARDNSQILREEYNAHMKALWAKLSIER